MGVLPRAVNRQGLPGVKEDVQSHWRLFQYYPRRSIDTPPSTLSQPLSEERQRKFAEARLQRQQRQEEQLQKKQEIIAKRNAVSRERKRLAFLERMSHNSEGNTDKVGDKEESNVIISSPQKKSFYKSRKFREISGMKPKGRVPVGSTKERNLFTVFTTISDNKSRYRFTPEVAKTSCASSRTMSKLEILINDIASADFVQPLNLNLDDEEEWVLKELSLFDDDGNYVNDNTSKLHQGQTQDSDSLARSPSLPSVDNPARLPIKATLVKSCVLSSSFNEMDAEVETWSIVSSSHQHSSVKALADSSTEKRTRRRKKRVNYIEWDEFDDLSDDDFVRQTSSKSNNSSKMIKNSLKDDESVSESLSHGEKNNSGKECVSEQDTDQSTRDKFSSKADEVSSSVTESSLFQKQALGKCVLSRKTKARTKNGTLNKELKSSRAKSCRDSGEASSLKGIYQPNSQDRSTPPYPTFSITLSPTHIAATASPQSMTLTSANFIQLPTATYLPSTTAPHLTSLPSQSAPDMLRNNNAPPNFLHTSCQILTSDNVHVMSSSSGKTILHNSAGGEWLSSSSNQLPPQYVNNHFSVPILPYPAQGMTNIIGPTSFEHAQLRPSLPLPPHHPISVANIQNSVLVSSALRPPISPILESARLLSSGNNISMSSSPLQTPSTRSNIFGTDPFSLPARYPAHYQRSLSSSNIPIGNIPTTHSIGKNMQKMYGETTQNCFSGLKSNLDHTISDRSGLPVARIISPTTLNMPLFVNRKSDCVDPKAIAPGHVIDKTLPSEDISSSDGSRVTNGQASSGKRKLETDTSEISSYGELKKNISRQNTPCCSEQPLQKAPRMSMSIKEKSLKDIDDMLSNIGKLPFKKPAEKLDNSKSNSALNTSSPAVSLVVSHLHQHQSISYTNSNSASTSIQPAGLSTFPRLAFSQSSNNFKPPPAYSQKMPPSLTYANIVTSQPSLHPPRVHQPRLNSLPSCVSSPVQSVVSTPSQQVTEIPSSHPQQPLPSHKSQLSPYHRDKSNLRPVLNSQHCQSVPTNISEFINKNNKARSGHNVLNAKCSNQVAQQTVLGAAPVLSNSSSSSLAHQAYVARHIRTQVQRLQAEKCQNKVGHQQQPNQRQQSQGNQRVSTDCHLQLQMEDTPPDANAFAQFNLHPRVPNANLMFRSQFPQNFPVPAPNRVLPPPSSPLSQQLIHSPIGSKSITSVSMTKSTASSIVTSSTHASQMKEINQADIRSNSTSSPNIQLIGENAMPMDEPATQSPIHDRKTQLKSVKLEALSSSQRSPFICKQSSPPMPTKMCVNRNSNLARMLCNDSADTSSLSSLHLSSPANTEMSENSQNMTCRIQAVTTHSLAVTSQVTPAYVSQADLPNQSENSSSSLTYDIKSGKLSTNDLAKSIKSEKAWEEHHREEEEDEFYSEEEEDEMVDIKPNINHKEYSNNMFQHDSQGEKSQMNFTPSKTLFHSANSVSSSDTQRSETVSNRSSGDNIVETNTTISANILTESYNNPQLTQTIKDNGILKPDSLSLASFHTTTHVSGQRYPANAYHPVAPSLSRTEPAAIITSSFSSSNLLSTRLTPPHSSISTSLSSITSSLPSSTSLSSLTSSSTLSSSSSSSFTTSSSPSLISSLTPSTLASSSSSLSSPSLSSSFTSSTLSLLTSLSSSFTTSTLSSLTSLSSSFTSSTLLSLTSSSSLSALTSSPSSSTSSSLLSPLSSSSTTSSSQSFSGSSVEITTCLQTVMLENNAVSMNLLPGTCNTQTKDTERAIYEMANSQALAHSSTSYLSSQAESNLAPTATSSSSAYVNVRNIVASEVIAPPILNMTSTSTLSLNTSQEPMVPSSTSSSASVNVCNINASDVITPPIQNLTYTSTLSLNTTQELSFPTSTSSSSASMKISNMVASEVIAPSIQYMTSTSTLTLNTTQELMAPTLTSSSAFVNVCNIISSEVIAPPIQNVTSTSTLSLNTTQELIFPTSASSSPASMNVSNIVASEVIVPSIPYVTSTSTLSLNATQEPMAPPSTFSSSAFMNVSDIAASVSSNTTQEPVAISKISVEVSNINSTITTTTFSISCTHLLNTASVSSKDMAGSAQLSFDTFVSPACPSCIVAALPADSLKSNIDEEVGSDETEHCLMSQNQEAITVTMTEVTNSSSSVILSVSSGISSCIMTNSAFLSRSVQSSNLSTPSVTMSVVSPIIVTSLSSAVAKSTVLSMNTAGPSELESDSTQNIKFTTPVSLTAFTDIYPATISNAADIVLSPVEVSPWNTVISDPENDHRDVSLPVPPSDSKHIEGLPSSLLDVTCSSISVSLADTASSQTIASLVPITQSPTNEPSSHIHISPVQNTVLSPSESDITSSLSPFLPNTITQIDIAPHEPPEKSVVTQLMLGQSNQISDLIHIKMELSAEEPQPEKELLDTGILLSGKEFSHNSYSLDESDSVASSVVDLPIDEGTESLTNEENISKVNIDSASTLSCNSKEEQVKSSPSKTSFLARLIESRAQKLSMIHEGASYPILNKNSGGKNSDSLSMAIVVSAPQVTSSESSTVEGIRKVNTIHPLGPTFSKSPSVEDVLNAWQVGSAVRDTDSLDSFSVLSCHDVDKSSSTSATAENSNLYTVVVNSYIPSSSFENKDDISSRMKDEEEEKNIKTIQTDLLCETKSMMTADQVQTNANQLPFTVCVSSKVNSVNTKSELKSENEKVTEHPHIEQHTPSHVEINSKLENSLNTRLELTDEVTNPIKTPQTEIQTPADLETNSKPSSAVKNSCDLSKDVHLVPTSEEGQVDEDVEVKSENEDDFCIIIDSADKCTTHGPISSKESSKKVLSNASDDPIVIVSDDENGDEIIIYDDSPAHSPQPRAIPSSSPVAVSVSSNDGGNSKQRDNCSVNNMSGQSVISSQANQAPRTGEDAVSTISSQSSLSGGSNTVTSRNCINALGTWSKEEVSAWLKKNKLDKICLNLNNLDGPGLQRMAFECHRDHDLFYSRVKKSLGLSLFQTLVIIRCLKSLVQEDDSDM